MRSHILRGLMIAMLTLSVSSVVLAGPLEDGIAAHYRGDYATAMQLLRPLAEQGNAKAQTNLGILYGKGNGVTRNFQEAAKWWRLAAAQGLAQPQYNLGVMYDEGQGVTQDFKEAIKWYRLCASEWRIVSPINKGGASSRRQLNFYVARLGSG